MARSTRAILKHYSSTVEEPKHDDCPAGASSWSSFQRDIANGTNLHKPIKNPLSDAVVEGFNATYKELLPPLGIQIQPQMVETWRKIDSDRIYKSDYRNTPEVQKRRKMKRKEMLKKQDAFIHEEGIMYQSQAPHGGKKGNKTKKKASKTNKKAPKSTNKGKAVSGAERKRKRK
ncbi:unnamed protein product, partial [Porites lobata]